MRGARRRDRRRSSCPADPPRLPRLAEGLTMLIGATLGRYFSRAVPQDDFARLRNGFRPRLHPRLRRADAPGRRRRGGQRRARWRSLALFRTPAVAEQVMPFAVLFGSMAALLQLSRKLELVVARAAGRLGLAVPAARHLRRLVIGVFSVAVYNPVSAHAEAARRGARDAHLLPDHPDHGGKEIWIRQRSIDGQAIIRADGAINDHHDNHRRDSLHLHETGTFTQRIEATEATLHEGFWELKDARVLTGDREPQALALTCIASNLEPSQVRQSFIAPDQSRSGTSRTPSTAWSGRPRRDAYRLHYDVLLARPLAVRRHGFRSCFSFVKILSIWWRRHNGSGWRGRWLHALCRH